MRRPAQRHRRRAPVQLLGIGDPVDLNALDLLKAVDQPCRQRSLVSLDAVHGSLKCGADHPIRATEVRQVFKGAEDSGEALVVLRPGLPTARAFIARRTNLVRTESLEQLAPTVEDALVRPVELVARANEKVAVDGAGFDRAVRAVVDGVAPEPGARGVGRA